MKVHSSIFTASSIFAACLQVSHSFAPVSFTSTPSGIANNNARRSTFSKTSTTTTSSTSLNVLISEYVQREVSTMEDWATTYGVQKADGVQLHSPDNEDYQVITQAPLSAGQPVLYVPAHMILSSTAVSEEFGWTLEEAEMALVNIDQGQVGRLPLFRLLVKLLSEIDKASESPFDPWLSSLPKTFYNGVSMTDACFECLPPYAAMLAMNERNTYSRFLNALRLGFAPISQETINNEKIVKWAYNVALTRFQEVWEPVRQKKLVPYVDMLNHSSEANCEITFDAEGNCLVLALYDIQPGNPLTVSYGDPTNPTPLFAKYGFLPQDCSTIFCKAMHLEEQIQDLGYDFNELLFQTETGEIAPKVWDIFLYKLLQDNDPSAAETFYIACKINDEDTKSQYHNHYFAYTLDSLKSHVYTILSDVERLTMKAQTYDRGAHPRVPVIVAHNNLVRATFTMTAALLEQMGW
eukprot:CAMPEP_0183747480 /NCGR_PEP_ID=MMETSP0737-20130205/67282_1 /TAXON_ID=385413 /ORGANISM="Thalassiosira miniscula, Strain CCMP1093" /LENGTH=464 /DNA_ID=CAMNT_0025983193 /DNA_START=218 /DNA_END=1609 /DNA_ORIENTATION=-